MKTQQYLSQLPKLKLTQEQIQVLYSPVDFKQKLINSILSAQKRIYIVTLYLEQDEAGHDILTAIYQAKQRNPALDVVVIVDWHRAQRGRIGSNTTLTNADWYFDFKRHYPDVEFPIYGIPINTREALGVLHLKGFIIDDTIIYSGASLNNVYLHQHDLYRYDRYHCINQASLANTMIDFIQNILITHEATQRLDQQERVKTSYIKKSIRQFRKSLKHADYQVTSDASEQELAITPLLGLGKNNSLNQSIYQLIASAQHKIIIFTPYFNLPPAIAKLITKKLKEGVEVNIIVGDKTANDFFIPPNEPFKLISGLPYLYEINLRRFLARRQFYVNNQLLSVYLWKDNNNTYHLKGIFIDNEWQLITGNNLNPRAWRLDFENGLLIHDPKHELFEQNQKEIHYIIQKTSKITHYRQLEDIMQYPVKVRKLIKRISRLKIDRLINRLL